MTMLNPGTTDCSPTAFADAFAKVGASPDSTRLRALVEEVNGNPAAVWLRAVSDKSVALLICRAAVQFSMSGMELWSEPPTKSEPVSVSKGNRAERRAGHNKAIREAAKQAAARVLPQAQAVVVKRALETYRLADGSLLKDRRWYELAHIARSFEHDAKMARAIMRLARPSNDRLPVGEIISPDQFDRVKAELDA